MHLVLSTATPTGPGSMMKQLGQRYVQYVNRTYRRSGTRWEGRFRSCLLQEEDYLLACQSYVELSPVRAAMVEHPGMYRWSSYRASAQGEASPFLKPHALHRALGRMPEQRREACRELFRYELDPGLVDEVRAATHGNYALGDTRFQAEVAATLARRATRGQARRPMRAAEVESGELF